MNGFEDTSAGRELAGWISRSGVDSEKVPGYAERLYERIVQDVRNTERSRLAEEAHSDLLKSLEQKRGELYAYEALIRTFVSFLGDRLTQDDDTAKRVYATIARFNLGEMFRPGGGADRYLIPVELTHVQPEPAAEPEEAAA